MLSDSGIRKSPREQEADWVERAKAGDVHAFERLYRGALRQVYGSCRRLLDQDADAEEMTQRAFVRGWQKLATYRGEAGFASWMRRIALHLILDERRARWREELSSPLDEQIALAAPAGRASNDAVDLERAIGRLPRGPRRVLLLHDVEGMTHAEIAKQLGVTTGTTKRQLFRARRSLREILG